MDKNLRRIDDAKIEELESRFDRHLEIYAKNGKELTKLGVLIQSLIDKFDDHLKQDIEWKEKARPLMDGYKSIRWAFYFVMAVGSLVLLIKQILK